MEIDARVEAWATLQLVAGLGPAALVTLLKAFGGPAEVLAASRASIAKLVAAPARSLYKARSRSRIAGKHAVLVGSPR